jgi:hypothetical protein
MVFVDGGGQMGLRETNKWNAIREFRNARMVGWCLGMVPDRRGKAGGWSLCRESGAYANKTVV